MHGPGQAEAVASRWASFEMPPSKKPTPNKMENNMRAPRKLIALSAVAALSVFGAACSDDDETPSEDTTAVTEETTAATEETTAAATEDTTAAATEDTTAAAEETTADTTVTTEG